jgi:hypothetical protein
MTSREAPEKAASLRFLSFSDSAFALSDAQDGSIHNPCCSYAALRDHSDQFSVLGARLLTDRQVAGEIGVVASRGLDCCNHHRSEFAGLRDPKHKRWENEVTWVRYDQDPKACNPQCRPGVFQFLQKLEARGRDPEYGNDPDPYYPPTALNDPLKPRLYTFRQKDTAVHFACPVSFLEDAPLSQPTQEPPTSLLGACTSGSQGRPRSPRTWSRSCKSAARSTPSSLRRSTSRTSSAMSRHLASLR